MLQLIKISGAEVEKYRLEYQNKTVQKNSMIFNNISINNMKKGWESTTPPMIWLFN